MVTWSLCFKVVKTGGNFFVRTNSPLLMNVLLWVKVKAQGLCPVVKKESTSSWTKRGGGGKRGGTLLGQICGTCVIYFTINLGQNLVIKTTMHSFPNPDHSIAPRSLWPYVCVYPANSLNADNVKYLWQLAAVWWLIWCVHMAVSDSWVNTNTTPNMNTPINVAD